MYQFTNISSSAVSSFRQYRPLSAIRSVVDRSFSIVVIDARSELPTV